MSDDLAPEQIVASARAADRYGERVAAIEQDYLDTVARADGDYSRVQHFIGLVRQELVNAAGVRRQTALEQAAEQYGMTTQPELGDDAT